ncbi:MAG: MaoC family dehydratase [Bernardetiaceae bacterium]
MSTTEQLKAGDTFVHRFSFSQDDVVAFAEVSGDKNPVHLDPEYAAQTMFKQPIMHGFLGASVFSKVFGTLFPGEGTIYLKQELSFLRPMTVDTEYEATFTVQEVNPERHRGIIASEIKDIAKDKITLRGVAELMNNNRF